MGKALCYSTYCRTFQSNTAAHYSVPDRRRFCHYIWD